MIKSLLASIWRMIFFKILLEILELLLQSNVFPAFVIHIFVELATAFPSDTWT